jgi:metallo-beta-lactamase family protein
MIRLTFHGAARTVTGSKYLLEAAGARILFDCGLFQGLKSLREKNWEPSPFAPEGVDAVVLSHAHIDHSGYLPRFVRQGFRGVIHATPATRKLCDILLRDAAKNQERDARYANRKGFSKHDPALPLFTNQDAREALKHFRGVRRGRWFCPAKPVWCRFLDVGHLLGSAMIQVEIRDSDPPLRLLFSGDVGRYDAPLYFDPSEPPPCDYLICESTYGNRSHPGGDLLDELEKVVHKAIARGGVMLMASFAIGRAQQLIYLLQVLIHLGRIPAIPIFLDSPMAVDATAIYRKHTADHDLSESALTGPEHVLDGPNVHLVRSAKDSRKLNRMKGPAVIISSSGMMTGGRILHHLRHRVSDPKTTIVLGGFMAVGTRGRRLQSGEEVLRIHGRNLPVEADITAVSGLSGHADREELLRWLAPLPAPRRVFLSHGEEDAALALAAELNSSRGWETTVPHLGESFILDDA